jgi:hypothetical protein
VIFKTSADICGVFASKHSQTVDCFVCFRRYCVACVHSHYFDNGQNGW